MRPPRWAGDALLAAGATMCNLLVWMADGERQPFAPPLTVLMWIAPTVPLLWRRTHPQLSFVAVAVACVAWSMVIGPATDVRIVPVFLAVALYSLARYAPPARSLAGLVVLCGVVVADVATSSWPVGLSSALSTLILLAFPVCVWLLGQGRRRIDEDVRRLRELTGQLRAERELSAHRAVIAERAHIARDLHDVVAHHLSAIAVVAHAHVEAATDDNPVRKGLTTIARTADAALSDMRRLLGLLAAKDEAAEPSPEATLGDLRQLTQAAESAGCTLTVSMDDDLGPLPRSLHLTAYRIVQEGLTNVIKHAAPTDVTLCIRRQGPELRITLTNGPSRATPRRIGGAGMGLTGLRERVKVLEGTLRAGPTGEGGWRLLATLPLGAEAA
ncbi:sensor histidine kinase [[Actinomadura] parvosata]|uniref:sensor histidine kinase n=1 Tax=[Actinomadura] parvosata TaxID=1955412 RepID=UPI0012BC15A3|nr:histidine kinase [Nonomuraea sp. ATCC 55076]